MIDNGHYYYIIKNEKISQVLVSKTTYNNLSIDDRNRLFSTMHIARLELKKQINRNIDYLNKDILHKKDNLKKQKEKLKDLNKEISKKEVQLSFYF